MARPRTFDEDVVVEQAMHVFWRKGYEATTIRDIAVAVGLGPGSLYAAFTDKHGIYVRALDRYCRGRDRALMATLAADGPVLENLHAGLTATVESILAGEDEPGCLIVHATSEMVPQDDGVTTTLRAVFDHTEHAIAAALERAAERGELADGVDPRAAARLLVTIVQGTQTVGKAHPDRQRLMDPIELVFGSLSRDRPASG